MWSAATGPKLITSFQPKVKLAAALNQSNAEILFHYKMLSAVMFSVNDQFSSNLTYGLAVCRCVCV